MPGKLALKRLTASDLTIFEYHFRVNNAGNQKSINLNRNIFIDELFPSLPGLREGIDGRIPLDIHLYGPGFQGDYNLQRKIIKKGTYKNWRLNGEFIFNPENSPERFTPLVPGDLILFDFTGDPCPKSARMVLVAAALPEDAALHRVFSTHLGTRKMIALSGSELDSMIEEAAPDDRHPIRELTLESALEDAAFGGLRGTRRLMGRRSGNRMTQENLRQARENAERIGREGEELVSTWLAAGQNAGEISALTWTSDANAVAPYDFTFTTSTGEQVRLDVKTTAGDFTRPIHVSIAELQEMAGPAGRYDLYRVYGLDAGTGRLRIARNLAGFARAVLTVLEALPEGVTPDSFSVNPEQLPFDGERVISLPEEPED